MEPSGQKIESEANPTSFLDKKSYFILHLRVFESKIYLKMILHYFDLLIIPPFISHIIVLCTIWIEDPSAYT